MRTGAAACAGRGRIADGAVGYQRDGAGGVRGARMVRRRVRRSCVVGVSGW